MLLNRIRIFFIILLISISASANNNINSGGFMSIQENWDKLLNYWKEHNGTKWGNDFQCQGATKEQLQALKNLFEEIPEEYLASLKTCAVSRDDKGEFYYFIDASGWGQLYGLEDIIKGILDYPKNTYISEKGAYEYVYGNVENPTMLLPKQWIPIFDWNADYTVAIDMLSKNKGQVIVFCLEDSTVAKWTDSYEEWFALAVDEVLKYGELRVETIESVLQMPEE